MRAIISAYMAQATQERVQAQQDYQQYQAEKTRLTEAAQQAKVRAKKLTNTRQFKSSEARAARGAKAFYGAKARAMVQTAKVMERRISHLEVKEKPEPLPKTTMSLGMEQPLAVRKALTVQYLMVRRNERVILSDVNFRLPTGSRTVVMGSNDSGKSTLLQTLLSDDAAIRRANDLRIGYFAQGQTHLQPNDTALALFSFARAYCTHDFSALTT